MDTEELKNELNNKGIAIKDCVKLKGKGENTYSYLVVTDKATNIGEVKKIKHVENLNVTWETYQKKRKWSQCHRCQEYGHGSSNCNKNPRCVKCAEMHLTSQCTVRKTENSTAKCCNCGGNHPANYSKCEKLLEYLEERNKNQRPHQPTQRIIQPNPVRNGISYATVTRKTEETNVNTSAPTNARANESTDTSINEMAELMQEMRKLKEICNINKMLQVVKNLNNLMKNAKSESEKFLILQDTLALMDRISQPNLKK